MSDDLKWAEHLGKAARNVNDRVARLTRERDELREALQAVTDQWPAAFEALAPSFRHMKSGSEVALVNEFDQAVIRGSKALATKKETEEG